MYDVYLIDMLFTKFLLTKILEILMVNKLLTLITRCFLEKMTNHPKIKKYSIKEHSGIFERNLEFSFPSQEKL